MTTAAGTAAPVVDSTPRLAPGVELLGELTGSGYREAPGLVRRGDGQTLSLTPLLYQLLSVVDGRRDDAELARALNARIAKTAAPEDVRHLLDRRLRPLGLLADDDGAAPSVAKANPLLALRFKVVVSNPALTRRITQPFTVLFRRGVVVAVLVAFALVSWWVLVEKGLASATRSAFQEPGLLLAVFALTVLSAGFHEFGHAAACRHAGATPGAMGAGLYLVWPAFYTDVDDSYRLGRRGRLLVDLGGLYFNAVVAVAVAAVWLFTRQDALLLGIATQLLQMVRQLAPFIRADGYHILADLTGVPDLFAHLKPTLLGLLPWRWRRREPTPLKRWARVVVVTWVLVVVPVLVALLVLAVLLFPRLAATAWAGLQLQWGALTTAAGDADALGVAARMLSILALALPVAAIGYLIVRVLRRTTGRAWAATAGRPPARAAAVVVAVALTAVVGSFWWPDGQYDPVRADERGTLSSVLDRSGSPDAQEVARASAVRSLPAGQPQLALALVPREAGHPVLLLTRTDDGVRTILTDQASPGAPASAGWAFPFAPPPADRPGDNTATAVNTTDDSVRYDAAYALVWVTDGGRVEQRNAAYAYASCQRCTTVAVAFQVVLVIGRSDVVAPVNTAVAANYDCVECLTSALAVQLVLTLREAPSDAVRSELEAAWAQLPEARSGAFDVNALYAQVRAVETAIQEILSRSGLIDAPTAAPSLVPGSGPTPSGSPDAAVATSSEPTASPTAGEQSLEATGAPEPEATASAEPSPAESSPEEPPAEEKTAEPAPTPTA